MDEKAQTSFEYILLLAGILLVSAMVYLVLRTGAVAGGEQQVNTSYYNYKNATNTSGYV
ncbi:MAG TPA: class III signal peptide-containing protein [Candidatus Norongarragalinales archaeon]|nr:class III signal peptide-containing protein [Candidatus Norongarragalinales archaeon]